jgi:predicted nucleic-acid-binding protein
MRAADTNVLVRLLRQDHPQQAAASEALFAGEDRIWIAKTVLLETGWVLGSAYRVPAGEVTAALAKLVSLPNVTVEDAPGVAQALALAAHGLDFADALHLASRPAGAVFVSFDRKLVRRAQRAGVSDIAGVE